MVTLIRLALILCQRKCFPDDNTDNVALTGNAAAGDMVEVTSAIAAKLMAPSDLQRLMLAAQFFSWSEYRL